MGDKTPDFQHPQSQSSQPAYGQVYSNTPNITDLAAQVQDLNSRFNLLSSKRINLNTDLIGLFQTVTAAPTQIPNNPYQQIQIAIISGTHYLYIYDPTTPVGGSASNGWFRVTIA